MCVLESALKCFVVCAFIDQSVQFAKGAENDQSPNLTVASNQRTLRTKKAVGMCVCNKYVSV